MRGKINAEAKQFTREAVAYIAGSTSQLCRQFAESAGLPYQEIADGVSLSLANQGTGSHLPLSEVRSNSRPSTVVLPTVAMDGSAHQRMQRDSAERRTKVLALSAKEWSAKEIADKLALSKQTVYNIIWHARKKK